MSGQGVQADRAAPRERGAGGTLVAVVAERTFGASLRQVLDARDLELALFEEVEELLELEAEPPSIVVLRVEDGIAPAGEVGRLRAALGEPPVVLVCGRGLRGWEVRAALAAGAAGVVLQDEVERALGPCLAAVRAEQVCVPRMHGQRIDPAALSSREKQILGLVVMGQTNGQIAARLVLAESTVKSHLSSAFAKLGVRSRHEAVDLILDAEQGLALGILGLGGERLEASLSTAAS